MIAATEPVGQTTSTATVHGTIEASSTSTDVPSAAQIAATSARGSVATGACLAEISLDADDQDDLLLRFARMRAGFA